MTQIYRRGPFGKPGEQGKISAFVEAPASISYSGELAVTVNHDTLQAPRFPGKIVNAWLTTKESGRHDTLNSLYIEGDVFINGASALTTKPKIVANSGEASEQKTTIVTGDTNITQAVVNESANTYLPGDSLTASFLVTRVSGPTTELSHPVLVVEFAPTYNL